MPPTFHIENFGCRAARADGEAIAALLRAADAVESHPTQADVIIVNTCSVTAEADREARASIRRAHRLNPAARIIATGCYAQRAPEELAAIPGVSAVVGNSHKALAPQIALSLAMSGSNLQTRDVNPTPIPSLVSGHDFSRAESDDYALKGHDFSRAESDDYALKGRDFSRAESDDYASKGHDFSRAGHASVLTGALAPEGTLSQASSVVSIQSLIANSTNQPVILADDTFSHSFLEEAPITPGAQTRPNLKIQEGCSNRCSFCVIPQTRGNSRSLSAESVLSHVRNFVAADGNELVLSGINLGRWGRDRSPEQSSIRTLSALVRTIIEQTDLPKLRLSSIEPMDWDSALIHLIEEYGGSRLCRHAHLPLQSGSDSVLRRMHRRYRPWHYAEKVNDLLRAAGPSLTLGADVMVGFPGETDHEFQETYDFIRDLPFGYLHLFPFSPRPGTRAWALHAESPVPTYVVNERMAALRALTAEKTRAHRRRFLNAEVEAITLRSTPALASAGRTSALTENFLPVEIAGSLPPNQLVRLRVTDIDDDNTLLSMPALSSAYQANSQFGFHSVPPEPLLETVF